MLNGAHQLVPHRHSHVDNRSLANTGAEPVDLPGFDGHGCAGRNRGQVPDPASGVHPRTVDELGGEDPVRQRRPHGRVHEVVVSVQRQILTGSSGVPHPAVVECNDERFQSFTRRFIRYVRNPLRYEAGTEPITDLGKDLIGTTSDRYGLVRQYRPSKPHLMATARHPVTAPRLSDGSGQVREDRRPRPTAPS